MKIRVFTTNDKGKVEFTKDELEKLLNEVYQDGQNSMFTITTPSTNPWWETNGTITTPLTNPSDDSLKITY